MKAALITSAAMLSLALAAGSASAAAGGNGKGNSGNSNNNSGGNTTPVLASCAGSDISVSGASCLGFFSGNLNGNKNSISAINTDLASWGVHLSGAVAPSAMLSSLTSTTINFSQQLYGDTIIGIHYGVVTGANGATSNNVTAFYRFDAGTTGIDTFTTAFGSVSNATLYATGVAAAVPEPSSYALMAGGLGLLGLIARRRKQA